MTIAIDLPVHPFEGLKLRHRITALSPPLNRIDHDLHHRIAPRSCAFFTMSMIMRSPSGPFAVCWRVSVSAADIIVDLDFEVPPPPR